MAITHNIGLEIAEHSIRTVEMRSTDGFPAVLRTSVIETDDDFTSRILHEAPAVPDLAARFTGALASALHACSTYAHTVSVALATQIPLLATLPSDAGLSLDEKRRQFAWECRTLLGLDATEPIAIQSFLLSREETFETWLVSALPQRTVAFIRDVLSALACEVRALDISHFVIENGIRDRQTPPAHAAHAVVGVHARHCDAGLHVGREYAAYRSTGFTGHEPLLQQTLRHVEAMLADHASVPLAAMDLHGPLASEDLARRLSERFGVPVGYFDARSAFSFLAGSDAELARARPKASLDAAICAAWLGLRPRSTHPLHVR